MTDFDGADFNFSFAPGTTDEQILGFEMAGEIWSHYLRDNVAVNIHVEMTDQLPENVIGGALPGMQKDVKYDDLWNKFSEDITSSNDLSAVNNRVYDDKNFTALVNGRELKKVENMKLTNANAKALGFIGSNSAQLDGYILMSDFTGQTNVQWDYDPLRNDNIADNSLDFLSVAIHEIGHVLGFVSGVDDGQWLQAVTESNGGTMKGSDMKFATSLDLFRYSSKDRIDFSIGQNPYFRQDRYFSIDGGNSKLAYFASGESSNLGGDGYQASHWKHNSGNPLGIMDPVLKMGQRREISNLDTTAMDVIGWDVTNSTQLDWQQLYNNAVANAQQVIIGDRTNDVGQMIQKSHHEDVYKWGYRGWWQKKAIWQHIKFQSLDAKVEVEVEPNIVQPKFHGIEVALNKHFPKLDIDITIQNKNDQFGENEIGKKPDVKERVTQLIENGEIFALKSNNNNINLKALGDLISEKIEDMGNLDDEVLVMPI